MLIYLTYLLVGD